MVVSLRLKHHIKRLCCCLHVSVSMAGRNKTASRFCQERKDDWIVRSNWGKISLSCLWHVRIGFLSLSVWGSYWNSIKDKGCDSKKLMAQETLQTNQAFIIEMEWERKRVWCVFGNYAIKISLSLFPGKNRNQKYKQLPTLLKGKSTLAMLWQYDP